MKEPPRNEAFVPTLTEASDLDQWCRGASRSELLERFQRERDRGKTALYVIVRYEIRRRGLDLGLDN